MSDTLPQSTGDEPAFRLDNQREAGFVEGYANALDDVIRLLTGEGVLSKSYDPMTVSADGLMMHSYAFDMRNGGRRHPVSEYRDVEDICAVLLKEAEGDLRPCDDTAPQQTEPSQPVAHLPVRNGVAWIWAVWALKPGQAHLAALCTSEDIAERYRSFVAITYPGAVFHAEEAPVDHVFGDTDIRSVAFRAAMHAVRRRQREA